MTPDEKAALAVLELRRGLLAPTGAPDKVLTQIAVDGATAAAAEHMAWLRFRALVFGPVRSE